MVFTITKTKKIKDTDMTERVFITGDKHGTFTPLFGLAEKTVLYESDILIIAGDAGYVWNKSYKNNIDSLQQIFPGQIAFIDGNHENHALLNSMEVSIWNGGKVHLAGKRIIHLMRGEIYSIYGRNYFTFGGARSVDKDRRVEGESWWSEEEPTKAEIEYGKDKLLKNLSDIDYVITHETPLFARAFISREKPVDDDYELPVVFDEWYNIISESERLKKWYFGHMHVDKAITEKLRGVHNDILDIKSESQIRWV